MSLSIRRMKKDDIRTVLEIENSCFTSPLNSRDFSEYIMKNYGYVAEKDHFIIGYIIAEKVLDELSIVKIAVHPENRKKGIGSKLVNQLIAQAKKDCIKTLFLEFRKSNIPAMNMYKKAGFSFVRERRKYYSDNQENAVLMQKTLS